MNEFENKNWDQLLSKFFSPDQAEQIKKDFASADALFEKFPSPSPSQQKLSEIKLQISHQLENKKRIRLPPVFLKTAAAAAIIIIVSAVMLTNYKINNPTQPVQIGNQSSIWHNTDTSISSFEAEIQQLKNDLISINYGEENGSNGILNEQVDKAEIEVTDTQNTFWKG